MFARVKQRDVSGLTDRQQGSTPAKPSISRVVNFTLGAANDVGASNRPEHPKLHKMALVAYRNLLRAARIAFQGTAQSTAEPLRLTAQATRTHSLPPAPRHAATSTPTAVWLPEVTKWASRFPMHKTSQSSCGKTWCRDRQATQRTSTVW